MAELKWLVNSGNYYYFRKAPTHASSITLNKNSISLTEVGQIYQLTATVAPDYAVDKKVHWSSSDITVATVTQTGLVTCVTPGSCTITATCDGVSSTCSVTNIVDIYIDFLLVGGGGGGGGTNTCNQAGGGGGGGGVIYCTNFLISEGNYPITIGTGGAGGAGNLVCSGCDGGNSTFNGLTSYGGGGGGGCYKVGRNGGSGGGSGSGTKDGGTGCIGQGNNGGGGGSYGGGGGGACSEGTSYGSTVWIGGQGGNGAKYNISGAIKYYGGGGGGGSYANNNHGIGGSGGGTANATCYGGGGGGGQWSCTGGEGYNGYQGIFIARYPTACGYTISGGTCYTCGDYTIHCFTSDGTLTVS